MRKLIFRVLIIVILLICMLLNVMYVKYANRVNLNGYLKVDGTAIKNRFGKEIQLKGLSSHGLQWEDGIINYENLKILRDEWKINVFRIAMYTEENGYIQNKEEIKRKSISIIDDCINLGIYVVIDWHILSDNNPNIHKEDALKFFEEVSNKYKDVPNVIYEICNEPNGEDVNWTTDIVPYAIDVINVIRNNSPKALIIVGTSNWSRDIIDAANNQLPYENILYAFHFYSGTHGEKYRINIDYALQKRLPIFVSEWGTSTAENTKDFYEEESIIWLQFLNERKISWINWAFSNKDETTSVLKEKTTIPIDENLTQSGNFIKKALVN